MVRSPTSLEKEWSHFIMSYYHEVYHHLHLFIIISYLWNKAEQICEIIFNAQRDDSVSSVWTEIKKKGDMIEVYKNMKYVEKLNREALFTVFLSMRIREYPIYSPGRKFKTNKGSHFSHIIKTHAKLNCGIHYHRML